MVEAFNIPTAYILQSAVLAVLPPMKNVLVMREIVRIKCALRQWNGAHSNALPPVFLRWMHLGIVDCMSSVEVELYRRKVNELDQAEQRKA